jgi:hypothetical protein
MISTILMVASTTLKLKAAASHCRGNQDHILDLSAYHYLQVMDDACAGLLQLMVILADGLMVVTLSFGIMAHVADNHESGISLLSGT